MFADIVDLKGIYQESNTDSSCALEYRVWQSRVGIKSAHAVTYVHVGE